MIVGIGIDIVEVARIGAIYAKFGLRFARKILHPGETGQIPQLPAHFLASRFAAKEAAVKALGTGFSRGIAPAHVEVASDARGRPILRFHGAALARAQELGASCFHISLSHERACSVAVVILED